MNILYPEIETLGIDEIKKYQLERLNIMLKQVANVPYYKGKLPNSVNSFEDFSKLPMLMKEDLRKAFPFDLLSCPKENIVRVNASSGTTTSVPTVSFCTKKDLDEISKNEALHFSHAGLSSKDIIQCMSALGLFSAGWNCYQGSMALGTMFIPTGPGNTQRQIDLLKSLQANYTFSNPSYLQHLLEVIPEQDWKDISLKTAITGGEVLSEGFQKIAKEKYNVEVYNFYGMTEFTTHVASECCMHKGLHVNESYLYVEIIDPDTGCTLPDGEYGELVITNLCREGMPLIRYRTRDITRIIPGICECGRTHKRIEAITHRIDDLMNINGVNIFPSQIEECIYKCLPSATNYLIHVKTDKGLKKVSVDIEISDDILNNKEKIKTIEKQLKLILRANIIINPNLNFVPLKTIDNMYGKAKRVVIEE